MISNRAWGWGSQRARTAVQSPIANEPVTLIVNVAQGNWALVKRLIATPSQNLALTPSTPPIDRTATRYQSPPHCLRNRGFGLKTVIVEKTEQRQPMAALSAGDLDFSRGPFLPATVAASPHHENVHELTRRYCCA